MVRDALTGVYAKVALLERLEEEVHRGRRYGEPFSILMLDLDHFKSVNDAFGHARGDATLTEFVERVQTAARNSDVLFRFGGDEFVLFLPRTSHDQATVLASRLVEQISDAPFAGQPPLSLTVSVGVATLPDDGSTAEELLARADARMYEAKRDGRSRVVSVDLTRDAQLMLDEGTRLIERLDALDRANRFFDTLPSAKSGVLRIVGPAGAGRTRVLREMEKLAGLRGHRVIALTGKHERNLEALAALRDGSPHAAALPNMLTDPAEVAEALRRAHAGSPGTVTTITIDNIAEIDRASLAVVRGLLAGARAATAVGVIHTGSELDTDPAPPDTPLRDTIELRPLSRDGIRAWMRSIFRWEPPSEFIEWVHDQSGGLPGIVRQILLQLVQRRLLVRDDARWTLAEGFRALGGGPTDLLVPEPKGIRPPLTELVGRESPLRQLLRLVRTTHLVTLCGPGGSGKTRLALEAALEALESFRDGVAFVTLGGRVSAIELATAIASTLELRSLAGPDPWIALARELRLRRMFIVIDGFEGTAEAAERLGKLLEHAPDLRILVTSRARLHIKEEWLFHLEGLRVPKWPDPERARGFSAVQLFTERALAANPHFSIADADAPSVSRICQLLDGSPLAIEIAAAQTAILSCREIANDLESGLEGLSSYLPATPPDQLRFRAVMEQSWRMLAEETRAVFRRAAVFAAEFDDVAASKVAGAQASDLDTLVARGLVTRHASGRYHIHQLVREYALQKLDEFSRDRHAILSAFSAHYLDLARELGDQLRHGSSAPAALAEFAAELPNLRRAWELALADEQHALILSGGRALFEFFEARQYRADAEAFMAQAVHWLDAAAAPSFARADERVAEFVLARHGACLLHVGGIDDARRRLVVALAKSRRLGMLGEEAFCLRHLALAEQAIGNSIAADEYARGAVMFARRAADPHALVFALRDAAAVAIASGGQQRAIEHLLEAVGVEDASTAKPDAWSALLEIVEQLTHQGNIRLAGAVLLQLLGDTSAHADLHQRAQRLLDSLRSAIADLGPRSETAEPTRQPREGQIVPFI